MILLVFAAVIFQVTAYRFYHRFKTEKRRQEMVTWPTAPGHLILEETRLKEHASMDGRHVTRVEGGYRIYAQGKQYNGDRLLPAEILIDPDERYDIEQWLAEGDDVPVRFNPESPTDNFILAGHNNVTWASLYVFLFFGLALPAVLVWLYLNFYI